MFLEKVDELKDILSKLNVLENELSGLPEQQSLGDSKTSDLLHLIENNSLNAGEMCNVVKEIKKVQINRREVKQLMEIYKIFTTNIEKIKTPVNREFLICDISTGVHRLSTTYVNRVYSDDDFDKIMHPKKYIVEE